jgi:hypothetical protein
MEKAIRNPGCPELMKGQIQLQCEVYDRTTKELRKLKKLLICIHQELKLCLHRSSLKL